MIRQERETVTTNENAMTPDDRKCWVNGFNKLTDKGEEGWHEWYGVVKVEQQKETVVVLYQAPQQCPA